MDSAIRPRSFGMIPGYVCLAFLGGVLFSITYKDERFKILLNPSIAVNFGKNLIFSREIFPRRAYSVSARSKRSQGVNK